MLASENSKSWVFDTGSVAHICNSIQGLQKVRKLVKNEVVMSFGNGAGIATQAVGIMPLRLPSGFILELNNCYFVPLLCRNIISGSCLVHDGYSYKSENNGCSLYCKEMFYGYAPIVGGLFILNLECGNDVFNMNAKCLKKADTTTLSCGTVGLATSERNACKDSIKMEFYRPLILNHFTHVKLV